MQNSYQREADVAVMMQEMAMFSKYDGTSLSGSDATEAVYLYASHDFSVQVGTTTWGAGGGGLPGEASFINPFGVIVPTTVFTANLVFSPAGGQVIGIVFN
jgi:hypothetical protein